LKSPRIVHVPVDLFAQKRYSCSKNSATGAGARPPPQAQEACEMSDEPQSPTGQGANEATLARHLLELRQTLDRLTKEDSRLELQQIQLQSQIARYEDVIESAQTADKENLLRYAQERLSELQPQLTKVEELRARLKTQKDALTQEQQTLLAQLGTQRASRQSAPDTEADPTWKLPEPSGKIVKFRRKRSPGRWILGFSVLALILIVALTLTGVVRLPLAALTQSQKNQGNTGIDIPFFTVNATTPDNQRCVQLYRQSCFSPEDMQQAFRLNPLYRRGYIGTGQTIALISVGNTTHIQADLQQFDQSMGLPAANLTILQPFGPPTPYTCPDGQDDLQGESLLDVEWAHAIAPGAKLVLLIGTNDSQQSQDENCLFWGLGDAIRYAVDQQLAQIISISYAGSELGDIHDTPDDKAGELRYYGEMHTVFQQAVNQGITILAAAGDDGATNPNDITKPASDWDKPNVSWPASDADVLAVGGTRLNIAPQTSLYTSEVVWNDSGSTGGGISTIFTEPDYQKQLPDQSLFQGKRAIPDVSFPAEGFLVYDSTQARPFFEDEPLWAHWSVFDGTSASTPCWAGLIAIANQLHNKPLGLVQPALYSLNGKDMHDILSGDNSYANVQGYRAGKGFDLATGWGTPIANSFLPDLVKAADQLGQNSA
jgi:hypothetical protein